MLRWPTTKRVRIEQALATAIEELSASESPQLDARLLLAAALDKPQSYLFTWPEREVDAPAYQQFRAWVSRRVFGEPIAYILGYQDFWTLTLKVSPATLIPRPETELLVEQALQLNVSAHPAVLDLGTGTGAVALALAKELPEAEVVGVDAVEQAVSLAHENATLNNISNASFLTSNWFSALKNRRFNLMVSNPPYVEAASPWLVQGDVRFEPASALTSGDDGLDDIREIVATAPSHLHDDGWLLIEHGYQQGESVRHIFASHGFSEVHSVQDLNRHERVTFGRLRPC